jgi:integrase
VQKKSVHQVVDVDVCPDLPAHPTQTLSQLTEQAYDYASKSKAANSIRAYRADWDDFSAWCQALGLADLPAAPQTIALYLTARAATCKVATLQRRLTAISQAHRLAGHAPISTRMEPIRTVWAGIRRVHGVVQKGKTAAVTDDIRAMIDTLPATLLGARDRALLLIGFAAALRRSELVNLDVAHVTTTRDGLVLYLPRSKSDQEGEGAQVGVPYGSNPATCPVRAVTAWLEASGITAGPLFRRSPWWSSAPPMLPAWIPPSTPGTPSGPVWLQLLPPLESTSARSCSRPGTRA